MPRRGKAVTKRTVEPDAKYQSVAVTKFMHKIMLSGKKATAEKIMYGALDIIQQQTDQEPLGIFEAALKNTTPMMAVKPRRIGGATYQVPIELDSVRGAALAMRWMIDTARSRKGKPMAQKLASEILDASRGEGASVKKRTDTHKMAEANRAFAHYKW